MVKLDFNRKDKYFRVKKNSYTFFNFLGTISYFIVWVIKSIEEKDHASIT